MIKRNKENPGHLNIHVLQHVPFEGVANVGSWAEEKGHRLTRTRLYEDEAFPPLEDVDLLLVLGGPMNIYEYDNYPWLLRERQYIKEALDRNKGMLGLCLGAQLIADVLGAKIKKNTYKEIGWFPVTLTSKGKNTPFFSSFPEIFMGFHWHGDMFITPPGSVRLAKSRACTNQAFLYGDRVLGLQFHLECQLKSIRLLQKYCGHEITDGPYIQQSRQMLERTDLIETGNNLMRYILDKMEIILRR